MYQSAVQPPSTISDEPVMSVAASLAKNKIAPVRSSSWPRSKLDALQCVPKKTSFWKNDRVISVSMKVGASVSTRI